MDEVKVDQRKCAHCDSVITDKAKKCPHCQAWQSIIHRFLPLSIEKLIPLAALVFAIYQSYNAAKESSNAAEVSKKAAESLNKANEAFLAASNVSAVTVKQGAEISAIATNITNIQDRVLKSESNAMNAFQLASQAETNASMSARSTSKLYNDFNATVGDFFNAFDILHGIAESTPSFDSGKLPKLTEWLTKNRSKYEK